MGGRWRVGGFIPDSSAVTRSVLAGMYGHTAFDCPPRANTRRRSSNLSRWMDKSFQIHSFHPLLLLSSQACTGTELLSVHHGRTRAGGVLICVDGRISHSRFIRFTLYS